MAAYETSLYLSILFECSVAQDMSTAILSHLVDMHTNSSCTSPSTTTTTIHLLHLLLSGYPSQKAYLDRLRSLTSQSTAIQEGAPTAWIRALARSLRRYEFITFDVLSRIDGFESSHRSSTTEQSIISMGPFDDLARAAISTLLTRLRSKARETAWNVMRGAYRMVSLSDEEEGEWWRRYLVLDGASRVDAKTWMEGKCKAGDVILEKEGCWKLCRVRR